MQACGGGKNKRYRRIVTGTAGCNSELSEEAACNQAACNGACEHSTVHYRSMSDNMVTSQCPSGDPNHCAQPDYVDYSIPYWRLAADNTGMSSFAHQTSGADQC